jgi:hypothetical protein
MNKIMALIVSLSKTQRIIAVSSVAVVISGLMYWLFAGDNVPQPDPKKADSKQVANYLASDSFGKLKGEQKMAYMDELRKRSDFQGPPKGLNPAQEEKIRQNMGDAFRDRMEKEMEAYAKMTPAEQTAFMDKKIDEMQERRKNMPTGATSQPGGPGPDRMGGPPPSGGPGGGPGGPGGPPGGGGTAGRDRMRGMLSNTTPKQRATMMKFMDAMRQRMKERGIEMPPPPGR